MLPVRRPSNAPEVVESPPEDKYALSERLERARRGRWTQSQKQIDPFQVETRNFPLPRPNLPSNIVPDRIAKPKTRRRTFGLLTTVILVVAAFLIGGGVGGGVAGSIAATEKAKPRVVTTTTIVMPTTTVTAPPITTTVLQDAALCPLVHNTIYNSTAPVKQFLQVCNTNLLPADGQTIDIKNKTTSSFDSCMDFCAGIDGCVAASWVMFSSTSPLQNSVCFLKNGLGVETQADGIGQVASGYLQPLP